MSLLNIGVFFVLALAILLLAHFPRTRPWRNPILFTASILAVFWLQPPLPIRSADFWLPCATLIIVVTGWLVTRPVVGRADKKDLVSFVVLIGIILVVALTRYLPVDGLLTASRPPQTWLVVLPLALFALVFFLLTPAKKQQPVIATFFFLLLLIVFVILKLPALTTWTSSALRSLAGQSLTAASALDLRWLGFSYLAFRILHTLRDRATGRLPDATLQEYLIYTVFFPAFAAGPIDRIERFLRDLRVPYFPSAEGLAESGKRLVVGLFKKFALADSLAIIALNATSAEQVSTAGWMWLLLYAYSFQILLDFSGYTDIAIGLGGMMGIRLPENFNRPYLRPSLTQFWNNWHITLTQWFRAYFFNPLTRWIRSGERILPAWLVIFITQLATMILIGLWHGITLNFILWGCWHGLGLFINNRWSEWMKPRRPAIEARPALNRALSVLSTLLTFHYVALGWVWFALPSANASLHVFSTLFGGSV